MEAVNMSLDWRWELFEGLRCYDGAASFSNLNKYIFQFGQLYFSIWTNKFNNLDKYLLQVFNWVKYIC